MMKLTCVSLACALLWACGNDNNTPNQPEITNPQLTKPDFVDVNITPQAITEGKVTVMLGAYQDNITNWYKECIREGIAKCDVTSNTGQPDGFATVKDAQASGIKNLPHDVHFEVDLKQVEQVLMTNPDGLGAGTARPDIFVEGHFSAFDLLRYLVATRDDLRFDSITAEKDTNTKTIEFSLSWDRNDDGVFDEKDGESNFNSHDWHFRFYANGGNFTRARGDSQGFSPAGETNYYRMDEFWVQPGHHFTYQPYSEYMTNRRQWLMKEDVLRREANGGKIIIPEILVLPKNHEDGFSVYDVEVKPFNMRPDIFQPDVITAMDMILSASDKIGGVKFTYWPNLSTDADVGHYALTKIGEKRSFGMEGWYTYFYKVMHQGEFTLFNMQLPTCDFFYADGSQRDPLNPIEGKERVPQTECEQDWYGNFGGDMVHVMPDVNVMNYGIDAMRLTWGEHYSLWGATKHTSLETTEWDFNLNLNDGNHTPDIAILRTFDLPKEPIGNAPILSKEHFGYKIADCTLCHNENKEPLGHGGHAWPINVADGSDVQQPHFCASCHGSNGAPMGHGEVSRCFWCHSKDLKPENHGDASSKKLIKGEEKLKGNQLTTMFWGEPTDRWGNRKNYNEILAPINNDWTLSKSMPDAYSCVTCHPNQ
ncbi:hypothetical protein [Ferrimonas sp. SCSIO 43195]|uniref:hypothetical protein n=1 Tax=Ferrimonas sp. SCSIO 43195 TaxID=2822844 RepID=UPI002074EFA7|nr:hypothetical protein [Ferrimonas sp. SCSIO 43195]USD36363.1 hypothetical protein J8Z22_15240 [Ferrimonas sp. SCSIO 43195]